MDLKTIINTKDTFPVMGTSLNSHNSVKMDFSASNTSLSRVDLNDTDKFNAYVFDQIGEKEFGYGGYLENRIIYLRSDHFQQGDSRCMHLGIDVWAKAFHPIFCPYDGIVHSFKNNDNYGDYGPTIILEHQSEKLTFYTLYGHLSINSLKELEIGQSIKKGTKFCELGPYPENGDWPPHLHFQLMTDMENRTGDFPGVCSPAELNHYQQICLNPDLFI